MIDLSSLDAVMQRIADIESKIGMRHRPRGGVSFQQALAEEMAQGKTPGAISSGAASSATGTGSHAKDHVPVVTTPSVSAGREPALADNAYLETIKNAARKYSVDPNLVSAVAEVESGFNQSAVSSAGAVGIMQLMPETAASLGVNPHDAAQNIEGGAHYLRQLLDSFHGDVRQAVAAYNAGPQAVRDYGGVPPYSETQTYVDSVLDLYR